MVVCGFRAGGVGADVGDYEIDFSLKGVVNMTGWIF